MDQSCLEDNVTYFACKISTLAKKYYNALQIGSSCAQTYLFQLELSIALIDQICDVDLDTEQCITEEEVCNIIDKLKFILDRDKCNCCD